MTPSLRTPQCEIYDQHVSLGRQVYSRGGTVADCAVAFALCMAVVAPHRVGLGGGFLATIYERKSKQVFVLDALPMAPRNLSEVDEDVNASVAASSSGGQVIATPGYLAGLEALHSRFGRLTWSSLFESAVSLAHFGFPVYPELAAILARFQKTIARRHSLRHIFWNRQTDSVYRENETLLQPELALTLLRVAREGPKALSQGTLSSQFLGDLEGLGMFTTLALWASERVHTELMDRISTKIVVRRWMNGTPDDVHKD
ncbi:hypothetical protein HPB51_019713 [Rhipicephalus microplus]|uniref:Gamma-glutamyltransferase n=1 Tax=Rhipicephalus microplus TaxID=6941 RepID=A0A9J6F601_RHIMP|nr:hypothetical protein HPB51_019713 [Rhipicephalus microplus]